MKKLVIFGAGNYGRKAYQKLKNIGVAFFVDNNTELCGERKILWISCLEIKYMILYYFQR